MPTIIINIILLFFSINCYTQDSLRIQNSIVINGAIDFFETDQIGNIYQVYKDEIIKLDPNGLELYRYSNKSLGDITQIDVSNSLRPLIFYRELSKIVVLDNTLSEQDDYTIQLDELGLYRALLIANSNVDNGVWIYDQDQKQILKVNTKLEIIQETGNLAILLNKDSIWPTQLIEKNGRLYMLTKNDGLFIFDIYGSYIQSIDISLASSIQIQEEFIYICTGGLFNKYNSKSYLQTEFLMPKKYQTIKKSKTYFIGLSVDGSQFDLLNQ